MPERDWSAEVKSVDVGRVGALRRRRRARFREIVEAVGREEHQRVVPLPLIAAALLLPLLAAWATAQPGAGGDRSAERSAKALAERRPPAVLDRERRVPADPNGYVDLWAAPTGWEARLLAGADRADAAE